MLTKESILSLTDFEVEKLDVPEWNGFVYLRTMSASDRDKFEDAYMKDRGNNTRARLVAYTVCDDKGKLLFSAADIPALGKKSVAALQRIFNKALEMNKISDTDIKELEGNSEADQ